MDLVETGGRHGAGAGPFVTRGAPYSRLEATGAVLFATLELRRPLLLQSAGTFRTAGPLPGAAGDCGHDGPLLARAARWLLGR